MEILRVTVRWSGFAGAPGYSAFHFSSDAGFWDGGLLGDEAQAAADTAADRVANAFDTVGSHIPSEVSLAVESEVEIIDAETGEILGMVDVDAEVPSQPRGEGGYSAVSGAVVNWRTNQYRAGRRIRGRTFIVPLAGGAYQSDGTLTSAPLNTLRTFASEMVGSAGGPEFGVWSRPRAGAGGVFAPVVSGNVPDMAAVLRSRRD